MDLMKNVPAGAWVFASVAFLGVLASFVTMGITGTDTAELRWVILTIINATSGLATVGTALYGGAAARNAKTAAEQTNGKHDAELQEVADRAAVKLAEMYRKGQLR